METKSSIPNMLRHYRKQAGLRQVDVAARLGFVSADRISHWEKGQSFPSVINLFKLSVIYKVSAEQLYRNVFNTIEKHSEHLDADASLPTSAVTIPG
jgi:transcriptional regulator with XRE-family HTH domain